MLADKSTVTSSQIGDVLLEFENANIRLKSALLIAGLGYNLLSVGQFADNGIKSTFLKTKVELSLINTGFLIGNGTRNKATGLYALPSPTVPTDISGVITDRIGNSNLWPRRLAHINAKDLSNLDKHTDGVPKLDKMDEVCRACRLGKATKLPFKDHFKRANAVGNIIHSDTMGPLQQSYPDRYRYAVTFQDDYLRYAYVAFMRKRSELPDVFHQFAVLFHSITSSIPGTIDLASDRVAEFSDEWNSIKRIHADTAKGYVSLQTDLGGKVMKTFSPPYTPQLNSIAERDQQDSV